MAYTVKRGDNLNKIATAHGLTLDELLELNPDIDNPNLIHPGDTIIVDPGEAETPAESDGGAGDYTDDEATRFKGLPGQPEIWEVNGKAYIVYEVPGTDPPVPIAYEVPAGDLEAFFGEGVEVVYDRQLTTAEAESAGWLVQGSTDDISATEGDPWISFVHNMEVAMETQPWLEDPEVFAVYAAAYLEGRPVEDWELAATDYWQTLTPAERKATDPDGKLAWEGGILRCPVRPHDYRILLFTAK